MFKGAYMTFKAHIRKINQGRRVGRFVYVI